MISYNLNFITTDGTRQTTNHDTFAKAAGAAEGLKDRCRVIWLNARVVYGEGSSHSGALYKYKNGTRECINKGFRATVMAAIKEGV